MSETVLSWVIDGDELLELLRRAHSGEEPELLYFEHYANAEHLYVDGDEDP